MICSVLDNNGDGIAFLKQITEESESRVNTWCFSIISGCIGLFMSNKTLHMTLIVWPASGRAGQTRV